MNKTVVETITDEMNASAAEISNTAEPQAKSPKDKSPKNKDGKAEKRKKGKELKLGSDTLISRQHSHVLMAGEMTISALTILFIPLLVSLIAPHNTVEEWSRLFISIPFVQLTTLALFLIFCDSKPRPWTQRNQKEGEFESDRSDEYRLRSVSYGR